MAAFQFHNRKLIINAVNETIEKVCTEYCDPTKNSDGRCPIACISICHPTCLRSFWPQIPPPTLPYLHTGSNDNRTKHHDSSASLFLTFPLATLAVALFLLCFYAIYRWWHGRPGRRSHPQDGGDDDDQEGMGTHNHFLDEDQEPVVDNPIWYIRTIGLQPSIISAITVVKYKRGDGLVDETGCAICLSEFQEDDTLRLLPKCNHAFHLPCIDTWLRSHTNCPMCRAAIAIATNSTAGGLPLLEQSVENYGPLQGSYQVEIRENNGEFRGDTEDEARELRAGTEGEDETRVDSRITKTSESSMAEASDSKSNSQPMRRSVSVDIVWDSITSLAVANVNQLEQSVGHSSSRLVKGEELKLGTDRKRVNANQSLSRHVDCSLIGRSVQNQKGPISMKRSHSCSGKVLSSRYSTSRDNRASPSSNF